MNKILLTITFFMAVAFAANCGNNANCNTDQTCYYTMTQNGYCCNADQQYCGCPSTFQGHVCSTGTCYDPNAYNCAESSSNYILCNMTTTACLTDSGESACCPSGTTCDTSGSSGSICKPNPTPTSNTNTPSTTTSTPACTPVTYSQQSSCAASNPQRNGECCVADGVSLADGVYCGGRHQCSAGTCFLTGNDGYNCPSGSYTGTGNSAGSTGSSDNGASSGSSNNGAAGTSTGNNGAATGSSNNGVAGTSGSSGNGNNGASTGSSNNNGASTGSSNNNGATPTSQTPASTGSNGNTPVNRDQQNSSIMMIPALFTLVLALLL